MNELFFDKDIIPKIGTFTFITNNFIKNSLKYDFVIISSLNAWEYLKKNPNDKIFWNSIKFLFYPGHNLISLEKNIFYLEFIALYGWTEFVIKCLNL